MTTIVTPDNIPKINKADPSIFLAGSIDNGKASQWQQKAIQQITTWEQDEANVTIYNPRRATWNADLVQSAANDEFNFQVTWELDHLQKSDAVMMWLEPTSLSPISLLELGLLAGWNSCGQLNKLVVGCPTGFWRKGNVEVVTKRYRIELVETFDEMIQSALFIMQRNHQRRIDYRGDLGHSQY